MEHLVTTDLSDLSLLRSLRVRVDKGVTHWRNLSLHTCKQHGRRGSDVRCRNSARRVSDDYVLKAIRHSSMSSPRLHVSMPASNLQIPVIQIKRRHTETNAMVINLKQAWYFNVLTACIEHALYFHRLKHSTRPLLKHGRGVSTTLRITSLVCTF